MKIKGHYGKTEAKVSCIDDYVSVHAEVPSSNQYKAPDLDLIRNKARYKDLKFEEKLQRWSPGKSKDNSPSPSTYKVEESIQNS
jgi:hypothetical protein